MKAACPIVLVHGAWHGPECWDLVEQQLRQLGLAVCAPALPRQPATFAHYTDSIVNVIQSLHQPVCLVGHSMAGMVISQVAELIPDLIDQLVYVAAYVPKDGQSLLGIAESAQSTGLAPYIVMDSRRQEMLLEPCVELSTVLYGCCDAEAAAAAMVRLQPQAREPFVASVTLGRRFAGVQKRAIVCRQDLVVVMADQLQMCEGVVDKIDYLDTDHSPFISMPTALAKLLARVEESQSSYFIPRWVGEKFNRIDD